MDRAEWPVSGYDPGTHADPAWEGADGSGEGEQRPRLSKPNSLCVCPLALPSFYLSLPAYIFSLSTSFLEPSLGRLCRAQSPFQGDPNTPRDTQQRTDTRATFGGLGG